MMMNWLLFLIPVTIGLEFLTPDRHLLIFSCPAQHLYEDVCCQRGQMRKNEVHLASDRMSCHGATANQVRLALDAAAFWRDRGDLSDSQLKLVQSCQHW
jgi:hypothetical protein